MFKCCSGHFFVLSADKKEVLALWACGGGMSQGTMAAHTQCVVSSTERQAHITGACRTRATTWEPLSSPLMHAEVWTGPTADKPGG